MQFRSRDTLTRLRAMLYSRSSRGGVPSRSLPRPDSPLYRPMGDVV